MTSSVEGPLLSVVVPCFNEEGRLAPTLDEMIAQLPAVVHDSFEIIVVDDGSSDHTVGVAEIKRETSGNRIRVVRHPVNRGKGAAVRSGAAAASGRWVLMADADGSTPITEVSRLLGEAQSGFDIVVGSRAIAHEAVTLSTLPHRKLLGRLFNGVVNYLVLPGIHDTQCGFKLFSRRVVDDLLPTLTVDHFGFDIELLMMARLRGYSVREIAVNWHHVPGSKVNLITDSAQMLGMVIRLYLRERFVRRS